jgi:hypothetical protein
MIEQLQLSNKNELITLDEQHQNELVTLKKTHKQQFTECQEQINKLLVNIFILFFDKFLFINRMKKLS